MKKIQDEFEIVLRQTSDPAAPLPIPAVPIPIPESTKSNSIVQLEEISLPNVRRNSNESEDTDSLSHYFPSSKSRQSSLNTTVTMSTNPGRSQSVIPWVNDRVKQPSRTVENILKSSIKRAGRASASVERKPSLSLIPLKFLRKKTKSVDFSHHNKTIVNPIREHDYVGDIELKIGHSSEREQLVIHILQAKNLLAKDANGFSDPFVKVYLLPGRE